jgi:hypothetical protein
MAKPDTKADIDRSLKASGADRIVKGDAEFLNQQKKKRVKK